MGRSGGDGAAPVCGSEAGSPQPKKKSLFKRLLTKGIRQRSVGRIGVGDGESSPSHSSATPSIPATPSGAPAPFVTAPSSPSGAAAAAGSCTHSGTAAGSPGGAAPASPTATAIGSGPRSLMVQVIAARRLRAADSNGLSDPYCMVKVGTNQASTKTELKTLEPRWNETMAFGPADVEEAEAEGRPYVALRVFDWDLVSADDFLGQAELPFADVDPTQGGPGEPCWLPLYGWKGSGKGAKKVDAGEICVQAWFEAGSAGRPGGSALSTLCCQPGMRKQVPLVVHSSQGSLYEEPLMVCLAVTLDRIVGMHVPLAAQAAGASKAADAEGGLSPAFSRASAISRNSLSLADPPGGKKPVLGGLLGRVLPGRSRSSNGRRLDRSVSMRSTTSDDMLAGEDPGDEYGGGLPFGYQEDAEPLFEGDGEDLDDGRRLSRLSPGSPRGLERPSPPPHPLLAARAAAAAAAAAAAGSPTRLAAVGEEGPLADGGADSSLSGMRCYVRLVLGRQKHTSFIKKERLDGTLNLQQKFVFAAPLPLRDREMRIEVYRTASSTQRGRLISIANVWLHDLLPAGLSRDIKAVRRRTVQLEGVHKGQAGGRAVLRCTLVDTDPRREMYQTPFLDGDFAEDVGEEADSGSEAGGGRSSQDEQRAMVQRLQSTTEGLSQAELRHKAMLTEKSFIAWQGSRGKQLSDVASDLAQQSWRRVSRLFSASEAETSDDSPEAAGDSPAGTAATRAPPALPAPAGRLELTFDTVTLAGAAASGEVFIVLKCGPHWGRSKVLPLAGHSAACSWHLSLPVLDPAAVLTVAVFQQSRGGKAKARPGFLPASAVQVVGKLRVRLSCLWPNRQHSASLPLLGERAKGAQVVGAVDLSLHASYASTKALFKGYTAPALPKAAYVHGVDDKGHQGALARESRRIVLRWLDSTNPPISGPVALTVLDAEREAFAMSRARLNVRRIQMALVGVRRFKRRFDDIKTWKEPKHSVAAMAGICFFCFLPRLAIPALLAYLVASTLAAQPDNAGLPAPMQQDPPGIEPENESLETGTANPVAALRAKLDRLQRVGLTVQNVLDGVACAMERFGALLSWQDPSATLGVCIALSAVAALIFLLGLSTVLAFVLCFLIRPPALRTPTPPLPAVVFGKLPTRADVTA